MSIPGRMVSEFTTLTIASFKLGSPSDPGGEGGFPMFERITEDTLPEYEAFVQSHPKGNFQQSSFWGRQKALWTWDALVVRDEGGKIKGSLAVMTRRLPGLNHTLMYGCRGPVCDLDDQETIAQLLEGARFLAHEYHSYAIRLDPDVPASQVRFGALLEAFGFRRKAEGRNFETIQPRYVFRLDVEGRSEEEVFAGFHSKWRYNIRLAQRKGVEVRVCGAEMVPAFGALMLETGVRDGFVTRPPDYFSSLLENLGEHARLYMAFWEGRPIAGALAIRYGDKVWYLYGASANAHRSLMPNYLLQWRMIQWAVETGCRLYDFRGVSGDLSEDNPLYGLYRFKKGFGGAFTEFVGELDLVLQPGVYCLAERGQRLYRSIRRSAFLFRHREKRA